MVVADAPSAMNYDERRWSQPGEPADAVPAGGQLGFGKFEQGTAVDRRQVHAAAAFEFAPAIMPVRGVQRVRAAEVLGPGHVRVNQLAGSLHGRGRKLAGYREGAGGCECMLDRIFTGLGEAAATG